MSFGNQLPTIGVNGNSLQLLGHCTQQTGITAGQFGLAGLNDNRKKDLTNMLSLSSGVTLVQAAEDSLKSAMQIAAIIDQTANTPATGFPNTDIGNQLAQVATLIKLNRAAGLGAKRQIYFCGQGGYDTHSDELPISRKRWRPLKPMSRVRRWGWAITLLRLPIPNSAARSSRMGMPVPITHGASTP